MNVVIRDDARRMLTATLLSERADAARLQGEGRHRWRRLQTIEYLIDLVEKDETGRVQ